MIRRVACALVVVGLLAGGCSSEEKVGSKDNLNFEEQEAGRLGERGATTEPPATTVPPSTAPKQTAPASTAPKQTAPPPTSPSSSSFTIEIISGGQGFDPFAFSVKKGTRLVVKNSDNQPRSFTSDDPGVFDSGMIPPGGSFNYLADRVGKFNFHDNTRPFAVGQMEVTP